MARCLLCNKEQGNLPIRHLLSSCDEVTEERADLEAAGVALGSLPDDWEMTDIFAPDMTSWEELSAILKWLKSVEEKLMYKASLALVAKKRGRAEEQQQ